MFDNLLSKIFETPEQQREREVRNHTLLKGTAIIMLAPSMMLVILVFYGELKFIPAMYGATFVFIISIIFVRPYIANLSALTFYVRQLTLDKHVVKPDLTFLNNVEELSEAVSGLHQRWDERKRRLEYLLIESRMLINNLPDIIIILDDRHNIIRTNTAAKKAFTTKRYASTIDGIINSESISATLRSVAENKKGVDIDFFQATPLPRHFIIRIEPFPVYSYGNIAFIIVMNDVTKQKLTEQMLSDFVANASHEIRTPLTSIIGFVETLQTKARDDETVKEEFLEIIRVQAERMSTLVKDLLSLSQIERNSHIQPSDIVNIEDILEDVMMQMEYSSNEKDMKINIDVPKNLPKTIGDISELTQVFENLIGNSIKYGLEGTEINIKAEIIKNSHKQKIPEAEKLISISVTDFGNGIAPEHLSRITERFYRANSTHFRNIEGTGLGLSIVKQVMDRHHGLLDIKSTIDKGSCFTVFLPLIDYC